MRWLTLFGLARSMVKMRVAPLPSRPSNTACVPSGERITRLAIVWASLPSVPVMLCELPLARVIFWIEVSVPSELPAAASTAVPSG